MASGTASWASVALAAQLVSGAGARAAEITVRRAGTATVIVVSGEIAQEDGRLFSEAAARVVGRGVVAFDSPGGSLVAGLQIGQVARLHHFATLVPDDVVCASACAFAWLSGTPRMMQPRSRIGFHAAYVQTGDAKVESGVGNALAGAYLNTLQLSFDAIVYVEQAHPDEITWLTIQDASRLGIRVVVLPSGPGRASEPEEPDATPVAPAREAAVPTRRPSPAHPPAPSVLLPELAAPEPAEAAPDLSPEDRARRFVSDYFAHWSESGPEALRFFAASYSPQVSFYGRTVGRDALLASKRGYAERWPVRVYTARPDTVRVFCADTGVCTATGTVEWDCRNPGRGTQSRGSARFLLTMDGSGGREAISAESGEVLSREPG